MFFIILRTMWEIRIDRNQQTSNRKIRSTKRMAPITQTQETQRHIDRHIEPIMSAILNFFPYHSTQFNRVNITGPSMY
jgi:hypothetical protein